MAWYNKFFKKGTNPNVIVRQIGGMPLFLKGDTKAFIDKGYTYNPYVYSIINLITKSISSTPFILYEVKDEKSFRRYKAATSANSTNIANAHLYKTKALEEISEHRILEILKQPNPQQGQTEFIENALGFKLLTGNAFIYGASAENGINAGKMQQLYVLPSQYMAIKPSQTQNDVEGYELELGVKIPYKKEEIIHLKYWNPNWSTDGSHLYGLSPLAAANRVLQKSNDNYTSAVKLLQNTGAIGILMAEDGFGWTEEQIQNIEGKYYEKFGGATNRGKVFVTNQKFQWQQIGMNAVDLDLANAQKMDLRDLCNIYGIQSQLLNDPENKTYANLAEARKSLIINRALPELYSLRDELNRTLVQQWSDGKKLYLDVDLQAIPEMQQDMLTLVQQLSQMWWVTGNEKRTATNYDVDNNTPELNQYMIPGGMIPIGGIDLETAIDGNNI